MATKVGLLIGRFQPFHLGHAHILKQASEENDITFVLVGSAGQARTPKNPFTFEEREEMITSWWYKNIDHGHKRFLRVRPLNDQPYNNAKWIQSVQDMVLGFVGFDDGEYTLYGSDRDSSTWYLKVFPQWNLKLTTAYPAGLSATGVRKMLFEVESPSNYSHLVPQTTMDFVEKFAATPQFQNLRYEHDFIQKYKKQWANAPYPPTFVTVDSVVIQSGHILVVERGQYPGKGLWALPGGFVKPHQTLRQAAIDELVEETGISLADGPRSAEITKQILDRSIVDQEIFDAPDRSLRGRTITVAFTFRLDDTKPLPKVKGQNMPLEETGGKHIVETRKAFFLPISGALAKSDRWFEDHHPIIDTMFGRLKD